MTHDEVKAQFEAAMPRGFDTELSMPQICRIRRGFETSTPLRARGVSLPPPARPPYNPAGLDRIGSDDEGAGSDGLDRIYQAESDFKGVCDNLTGRIVPDEAFESLRNRRAVQGENTQLLAKALECRGGQFHYGDNWGGRCTVIGAFSGAILPLPPVRRVAFMPSIAAAQRSKMLRDIEHFIHQNPHRVRMYTMTNGPRVAIDVELRGNIQKFHRRLSKLAKAMRDRFDVSIEWRATEFGTPQWDIETGQMTLHLHAHLLVLEPASMHPKKRAKVRKKIWRMVSNRETGEKRMWDDAGQIQNAREFVKYPVKDSDLETILREGGPGVLCDFYEAIRGLHIVQPMGELKSIRAKRRAEGIRVQAFDGPDGRYLSEVYDWNAAKRPFSARKDARERYQMRALFNTLRSIVTEIANVKRGDFGVKPCEALEESPEMDDETPQNEAIKEKQTPRIANRVIARLAPAPYGGPVTEPAVVVWGFDGNTLAVFRQPAVARLRETHRAAWLAGVDERARALIRASAHADARTRAASEGSQRSNNCPRAGSPPGAELAELALADAENDRN